MVQNDLTPLGVGLFGKFFERSARTVKPTWCKVCARKHPRHQDCELELIKDLTVEKESDHFSEAKGPWPKSTPVGYYRVKSGAANDTSRARVRN